MKSLKKYTNKITTVKCIRMEMGCIRKNYYIYLLWYFIFTIYDNRYNN